MNGWMDSIHINWSYTLIWSNVLICAGELFKIWSLKSTPQILSTPLMQQHFISVYSSLNVLPLAPDWSLLALSHPDHSGETDTYHVSVGHLFVLRCPRVDAHTNVTWSRGERHNLMLPSGVEVRDGLLWFLPVQMSHNGSYTCEKRYGCSCLSWCALLHLILTA